MSLFITLFAYAVVFSVLRLWIEISLGVKVGDSALVLSEYFYKSLIAMFSFVAMFYLTDSKLTLPLLTEDYSPKKIKELLAFSRNAIPVIIVLIYVPYLVCVIAEYIWLKKRKVNTQDEHIENGMVGVFSKELGLFSALIEVVNKIGGAFLYAGVWCFAFVNVIFGILCIICSFVIVILIYPFLFKKYKERKNILERLNQIAVKSI